MTNSEPVLLDVRDVSVHYGRIQALQGVSLQVKQGELVTLLGSNGAGKTTMMRALSGLLPLSSGSVWFDGEDIAKVKAHRRVNAGLIQAPEGRGIFPGMTIVENLEMGCYGRKFASKAEHRERLDWVMETFPRLAERRSQSGGTLSGGEQQMLVLGRALLETPKVLLLDEMMTGLAPKIVAELRALVGGLAAEGVTVIVTEPALTALKSVVDRGYVMQRGELVRECDSASTLDNAYKQSMGVLSADGR